MKWWKSEAYRRDVRISAEAVVQGEALKEKTVLVTGAGGLVGSFLTDTLLWLGANVIPAGRDLDLLRERFDTEAEYYDLERPVALSKRPDYIIHAAGYGHPAAFREDPVGTLTKSFYGTQQLLAYCKTNRVERFLLISSGEVYGGIDAMSPRACYPVGKQAAEALCAAYTEQYGVQTVSARLCHTFGPGFSERDNRAVTQFLRNASQGRDIVLKSRGEQRRSWCYAADSASAILSVLAAGESGEAYDIAAEGNVAAIAALAEIIAKAGGVKVKVELPDESEKKEQSPIKEQILSCEKLADLGWKRSFSLEEGVRSCLGVIRGR